MVNRPEFDEDIEVPFSVWPKDGAEAEARSYHAWSAQRAAEQRAREDYGTDATRPWPAVYCAKDSMTGQIWTVTVGVGMQPTFTAIDAQEVRMTPATHVLWGDNVLCADLRLRSRSQRDWPESQRAISLDDVRKGALPADRCDLCWAKAPGLVTEILEMMKRT